MENMERTQEEHSTRILFELLRSGDEALSYLYDNLNTINSPTCIIVSQSLKELYENIVAYIDDNNISEQHRGREAALNAFFATERLCEIINGNDFEKTAFLLTYELIPLQVFLSNELYFWFGVYPDMGKMHQHRDEMMKQVLEYLPQHEELLKQEYSYDVSIMVLCYNKVYLTKIALQSLLKYTNFKKFNVEIILVNNGSDDNGETSAFLKSVDDTRVKTIDLKYPMGYNAYSLGPVAARGRYFIEFHTDVIATENWLDNLLACITSDSQIGAVVAVCNESSNSQAINVSYKNPLEDDSEMQAFAKTYNSSDPLKWEYKFRLMPTSGYVIPTLLYRLILRDPWLYYGLFTDDDMSMYLRRCGFKQVLAKDTFLHHFGSQTSSSDIENHNSVGKMRVRFFDKWGVDAWAGTQTHPYIKQYIENQKITGSESFLFIDPYFGSIPMMILSKYKAKEKKLGDFSVIVSDVRYSADVIRSFYDSVLVGNVIEKLELIENKYDYIFINPNIAEYVDKDFPELIRLLRNVSKPGIKTLFTISNPSYYERLRELANGVIASKPYEPWSGVRFIDPDYISAVADIYGFNLTIKYTPGPFVENHTERIKEVQALAIDDNRAESMIYETLFYELTTK